MQDPNEIRPILSPGNDLAFIGSLWKPAGAGRAALTSADGLATGFIGTDPTLDIPVDVALMLDVTWLDHTKHPEWWSVVLNNSPDGDTALRAAFEVPTPPIPYAIVIHPGGCRAVLRLEYSPELYFTLT